MRTNDFQKPRKYRHYLLLILCVAAFSLTGCRKTEQTELYHSFPGQIWNRFNVLRFEIPVTKPELIDVYLFARFKTDFQYETLDFNMFMRTSTGEERIRDFQMAVKSPAGVFSIGCAGDTCEGTILLKGELNLTKTGVLNIEIENLSSRMRMEGIHGIGIRLKPSGK